jgi:hypothetical protein
MYSIKQFLNIVLFSMGLLGPSSALCAAFSARTLIQRGQPVISAVPKDVLNNFHERILTEHHDAQETPQDPTITYMLKKVRVNPRNIVCFQTRNRTGQLHTHDTFYALVHPSLRDQRGFLNSLGVGIIGHEIFHILYDRNRHAHLDDYLRSCEKEKWIDIAAAKKFRKLRVAEGLVNGFKIMRATNLLLKPFHPDPNSIDSLGNNQDREHFPLDYREEYLAPIAQEQRLERLRGPLSDPTTRDEPLFYPRIRERLVFYSRSTPFLHVLAEPIQLAINQQFTQLAAHESFRRAMGRQNLQAPSWVK